MRGRRARAAEVVTVAQEEEEKRALTGARAHTNSRFQVDPLLNYSRSVYLYALII